MFFYLYYSVFHGKIQYPPAYNLHIKLQPREVAAIKKLAAAALLLILILTSCGGAETSHTATDLLALLTGSAALPPVYRVYFSGASPGEDGFLTPEASASLYGTGPGEVFEGVELRGLSDDWAVWLSGTTEACEIHIFHARSGSDVPKLEKLLARRAETVNRLSEGNESFYPYRLSAGNGVRAEVRVSGRWVVLLSTASNDALLEMLR